MRRAARLLPAALVLLAFAGCDEGRGVSARAPVAATTAPLSTTSGTPTVETRLIDTSLSLRKGELERTLYVVRDDVGPLGVVVVGCDDEEMPTATSYRAPAKGTDVQVAVDGRGVSRAGRIEPGEAFEGGAGSGLEHWLTSMTREPDEVLVDAALTAFGGGPLDVGCAFTLRGTARITRHS
jgi:hypothetical protein